MSIEFECKRVSVGRLHGNALAFAVAWALDLTNGMDERRGNDDTPYYMLKGVGHDMTWLIVDECRHPIHPAWRGASGQDIWRPQFCWRQAGMLVDRLGANDAVQFSRYDDGTWEARIEGETGLAVCTGPTSLNAFCRALVGLTVPGGAVPIPVGLLAETMQASP